jgi:hypothetical protein
MNNEKYRKLTLWLIAAWFVFTLSASALHLFQTPPTAPPLPFGLAVLTPVLVFLVWFRISPGFRTFALSLDPGILTMIQSWRIAGFVFLALYAYGVLPGAFALPAGWGDIAIGLTAPLVSLKLASRSHRMAFIGWQILGIVDLVTAIGSGTMSQIISRSQVTTAPMTVLPLSLIPTFAVPLFLILHIICIAQARRWQEPVHARGGEPLPSSAV